MSEIIITGLQALKVKDVSNQKQLLNTVLWRQQAAWHSCVTS